MIYKILCGKGDAAFDYDVKTAEMKFDELKGAGFLPLVVRDGKNVPVKRFDPEADSVVWVPKIAGG